MKVFRVCVAPPYLQEFRLLYGLDDLSFDEQIACLRSENLLLPGGWAAAMAQEGFEVFETILDDARLQKTWAREHAIGVDANVPNLPLRILVEQIKSFQPRVIFIYAGALALLPRVVRELLRGACRDSVVVTGFWGDELPAGFRDYREFLGDLDLVFCCNSSYARIIGDAGISVVNLGNCFDDTIRYRTPAAKKHDFIFCGATGYGYPDHIRRYEKLREFMAKTNLIVWTSEPQLSYTSTLFAKPALALLASLPLNILSPLKSVGKTLGLSKVARAAELAQARKHGAPAATLLGSMYHSKKNYFLGKKALRKLYPGRVNGSLMKTSDYYELLAASKLVLNIHRDEEADAGNIRCFEATGLGACLVTDRREALKEFFDVDNDIVTFDTIEECIDKVSWLLERPTEIERIAKNGQRTTLSRHTVGHRCKVIAQILHRNQFPHRLRS